MATKMDSKTFTKIFAIVAFAVVFIPLFLILSMCSKIEKDVKNAPPSEGSLAGVIASDKK